MRINLLIPIAFCLIISALTPLAVYAKEQMIKSLIIVRDPQELKKIANPSEPGIYTYDVDVPGGEKKFTAYLKPFFLDKPFNEETFKLIQEKIIVYYRDQNRPVVSVKIPAQRVATNTLQVVVTEAKIGQILYQGNKHFKQRVLEKYVDFKPGDYIKRNVLTKDLQQMNRNPFRTTDVIYSPGKDPGTTDMTFITKDRRPYRFYAGVDNTGYHQTGYNRWYGGINIGNLFGKDQQLDYQYTMGPNAHKFYAHTVKYATAFPWKHYLTLYGGYSNINAFLAEQPVNTKGSSSQASLRYEIPVAPQTSLLQEVIVGFDYKRTTSKLNSQGDFSEELFNGKVNLSQFVLGYNLGWERSFYKSSFTLEFFGSPGQMLPQETRHLYNAFRPHATPTYFYGRAALAPIFTLPKNFYIYLTLRGQASTSTLLPSEQLGVGGFNTVRGYLERETAGDDAFIGNLEFRSPLIKVFSSWIRKAPQDSLQVLAFFDYGYVHNLHSGSFFEKQNSYLMGIGPGLRYNMGPYINARLDWGFQLHSTGLNPYFHNRIHFAAVAAF